MSSSTYDSFQSAVRAARKRGVTIRQNVRKCCRSCINPTDLGMTEEQEKTKPYAYTFGGQGDNYSWREDRPVWVLRRYGIERTKPVPVIYFNHGNGGAEILAEEMTRAGLDVEWGGEDTVCVGVVFDREGTL